MPVPSKQHQIFVAEEHLVWLKWTYLSSQKSLSFASDLKQFFHFKSDFFFWRKKVVKVKANDRRVEINNEKNDKGLWTAFGNQIIQDDAYQLYGKSDFSIKIQIWFTWILCEFRHSGKTDKQNFMVKNNSTFSSKVFRDWA